MTSTNYYFVINPPEQGFVFCHSLDYQLSEGYDVVAATYDGSKIKIYVNGILEGRRLLVQA